ncbi:MAG TPA: hypothetical protein VEA78_01320, partial [Acidimicrobiales bacterium]|nr:hypothetical protein [Acidimicrobiales bacterium]
MEAAIYIQSNAKQRLAARVAAHAMRRRAGGAADVVLVDLDDFPQLNGRDGQRYLRDGMRAVWRNDHLQSFTPLRFVVPQLRGFQGRALVTDPDVFALMDVRPLLHDDLGGAGVRVRRVGATPQRGEYFDTSVMALDCEKLTHWRWDEWIDDLFAGR